MAEKKSQSFENHGKYVPLYHFWLLGFLLLYLIWAGWFAVRHIGQWPEGTIDSIMTVLLALGLFVMAYYVRMFPLQAQDRLIRLEERMRMREVLPEDLRDRAHELSVSQCVALRFASDEELPELVRKVLDGELRGRSQIKQQIKTWRADHDRL